MQTTEKLKYLQGSMMFLASIANGLEELVGRGAPSVTFRAGRTVGLTLWLGCILTNFSQLLDSAPRAIQSQLEVGL